jgi:hypothetical protein
MIAQGKVTQQPPPWVNGPDIPAFFVILPRERRMTKKANSPDTAKATPSALFHRAN